MGNYELLPSVNLSCKNSLQREIHFRSDAKPSSKRARQGGGAAGGAGGRDAWRNIDFTRGPQAPGSVRVGGLLFYFISHESSANLPSLSLCLWGPRELLSFDKGERKSAPCQAAFARVPPKRERGWGCETGQGGRGWGVADLWLCRPRGGSTQHLRGATGKSRPRWEGGRFSLRLTENDRLTASHQQDQPHPSADGEKGGSQSPLGPTTTAHRVTRGLLPAK